MKKIYSLILILLAFICFTSCTKGTYYNVSFMLDGTLNQTVSVKEGEKVSNIEADYDKIQYSFDGWFLDLEYYDFDQAVTSDLVLDGYLTEKTYKIVFKNPDGSLLKTLKLKAYEEIVAPTNPKMASDEDYDYSFKSWDKEFNKATSDMEIIAEYDKSTRMYEVAFYDETSKVIDRVEVMKGNTVNLPTQTKETDSMYSYEFDGWYTLDGTKFTDTDVITSDVNLFLRYKQSPTKHSTKDMVVSIVGDSISTYYKEGCEYNSYYSVKDSYYYPYYSAKFLTDVQDTWWMLLINKLNAKLGINNSYSGSCCYNWGNAQSESAAMNDCRVNTLGENGDPDIILIYIGVNDMINEFTDTQFKTAYSTMVNKIKNKYPNAYLFFMNIGYSGYRKYGWTVERQEMYNDIYEELAEKYQATIIDINSIQTPDTYASMLGDSLHPNKTGMIAISDLAYDTINEYFGISK